MTSLLDVNVLISMLDATHKYHAATTGWLDQHKDLWASCPITQNGYLRIVTQEKYPNRISIKQAIEILSQAVAKPRHKFLADNISLLDRRHVAHRHIKGHKQLTDIYLLALSVSHGARFVTLDRGVSSVAVPQANNASVHIIKP